MIAISATAQQTFMYQASTAQVVLLSQGQRQSGLNILIGATPEMIAHVAPDNTYPSATNAFLIRTQSGKNILIDTGFAKELFACLQEINVSPESIDAILITHLHGDHIGGLTLEGQKVFPNATLMMSKFEAQSANENTLKIMNLYDLDLFDPNDQTPTAVFDDIKAMANYGHTPGHTIYFIDNVAIWGDMTHAMAFQMPYPQVAVTYDTDPNTAVKSRLSMLEYLVANHYHVGGMHIAWPGMGSIKEGEEGGYVFNPF